MKSSVQVTDLYERNDLVRRQIIGVVNFLKKQIGPFMSEFLVTGFSGEDGAVVLAQPEREVPTGAKLLRFSAQCYKSVLLHDRSATFTFPFAVQ